MKNLAYILLFMSVFSMLHSQTVTVDLSTEYQEIKGFGGINHPEWYSDLSADERALAFGNDDGQLGLTVLRTYVSDDSDNWSLGLTTTQYAYNAGATVFSTPWNPPSEMTYTDSDGDKHINPSYYSDYADHLNDYVTYMRNNGVELYSISVQNEPDYAEDWTEWDPDEAVDFIKGYADQIDCRLMTPESFQYRKDVYDPILNDAEALANVDIFGTHLYGTTYANFEYPLFESNGTGKELWMTEVYTNSDHDANLWTDDLINTDYHAIKVAEHIHYAMTAGNFQTYVYWPIRRYYALIHDGNSDSYGNTAATAGTATKRGWCMAQFSKFIRPGYIRVDATSEPTTNVFVSAYKDGNDIVIVAVNKTTSSQSITFSIPNSKVTTWEQYVTSSSKNVAQGSDFSGTTSFQVTLEAASVTTFVGNADDGIPTVEITADTLFAAPATVSFAVEASDEDGTVTHVDFYINDADTTFHEEWVAPYDFEYEFTEAGTYEITAIVYDDEGNTSEDVITITVNPAQASYTGTPHVIPGTIEFEEFDIGGNGFAYYDDSEGSETGNSYRSDEDVDIEDCSDTGGGYGIGYATAGEWLEYTVDVETTGTYDLVLRVACNGDSRTLSLSTDGTDIATDVAITNTAGWQVWTDVTVNDIELTAGEQVLRLTMGATNYLNLNYMTFTLIEETTLTIQLYEGWNLIGCPIEGSTEISSALSSIWDYVEVVKDMNGFYLKSQDEFLNSLNSLDWGKGYFVKVNADCELDWIAR